MKSNRKQRASRTVGQRLVASMREVVSALESGEPLESQLTVRTVEISDPGTYSARLVRALRSEIGASQAVFAKLLGISVELVQNWEQGVTTPRPIARRLLDEVSRDPAAYAARTSSNTNMTW